MEKTIAEFLVEKKRTRDQAKKRFQNCILFIDESNIQKHIVISRTKTPQPVILELSERAADIAWKIVCIQSIQFYMFCVPCHNGWFGLAKYAFYSFHFKFILIAFDQTFYIMHTQPGIKFHRYFFSYFSPFVYLFISITFIIWVWLRLFFCLSHS